MSLLAAVPAAEAATTDTWTGQGSASTTWPTLGDWQNPSNWSAGAFVNNDVLAFPRLGSCVACYTSEATALGGKTTALSATSLSIGDDLPYQLLAAKYVTLALNPPAGTDGLDAAATGAALGTPYIAAPLVLGDSQRWSVAGDGAVGGSELSLLSVNGPSHTLTLALSNAAQVFFDGLLQTGGLTVTGSGSATPAANGEIGLSEDVGSGPITVQDAAVLLGAYNGATVQTGSLTVDSGALTIGNSGPSGPGRTAASGTVAIDGGSTTTIELEGTGTTAGTAYGQLAATGNVTVGGQLSLVDESGPTATCPTATLGTVDTFITTSGGTLSGTFANLPNGAITSFTAQCGGSTLRYPIQINYTSTAVTGTFVAPAATSTALSIAPASPTVGTNVTLTATVSNGGPGAGTPTGAVQFLDGSTPITCSTDGLLSAADPAVATCTTNTLPTGTDTIYAHYGGDGAWTGSSTAVTVTVSSPTASTPVRVVPHFTPGTGFPSLDRPRVRDAVVEAPVSCQRRGASCAVRLLLLLSGNVRRGKRVVWRTTELGEATRTVPSGARRVVTVRLDATGRRWLAGHHVLHPELVLERVVGRRALRVAARSVTLRSVTRHR